MTRHDHPVRRILTALIIALSLTTVGAGAAAADDPGMTHNGTDMVYH